MEYSCPVTAGYGRLRERQPAQHASRVLRILKLDDLVEDTVFCDYATPGFACKPEPQYYSAVCTAIAPGDGLAR